VKGKVIVMLGCLDGKDEFAPQQEFFCGDSCVCMEVLSGTEEHDGMV
jgi:hypothetical protein